MIKRALAFFAAASLAFLVLLWAPWITDDYAINKVVEKLGGPETRFNYLGDDMAVKDVPKQVSWAPFGRFLTFQGEAGWTVSFFGNVS